MRRLVPRPRPTFCNTGNEEAGERANTCLESANARNLFGSIKWLNKVTKEILQTPRNSRTVCMQTVCTRLPLTKNLGPSLIIYIIVHADTSKKRGGYQVPCSGNTGVGAMNSLLWGYWTSRISFKVGQPWITNLRVMWTDGWVMSNCTQNSQKVCTKLLSLPDKAKKLNFQSLS